MRPIREQGEVAKYEQYAQEWQQIFAEAAAYLSARVRPTRIALEHRTLCADLLSPAGFVLHREPTRNPITGHTYHSTRDNSDEVHFLLPSGELLLIYGKVVRETFAPPTRGTYIQNFPFQLEMNIYASGLEARQRYRQGTWAPFRDFVVQRCIAALDTHEPLP